MYDSDDTMYVNCIKCHSKFKSSLANLLWPWGYFLTILLFFWCLLLVFFFGIRFWRSLGNPLNRNWAIKLVWNTSISPKTIFKSKLFVNVQSNLAQASILNYLHHQLGSLLINTSELLCWLWVLNMHVLKTKDFRIMRGKCKFKKTIACSI